MYADILINALLCTICGLLAFSGFAGAAAVLAFTMSLVFAGLLVVDVGCLIITRVQRHNQSFGTDTGTGSFHSNLDV